MDSPKVSSKVINTKVVVKHSIYNILSLQSCKIYHVPASVAKILNTELQPERHSTAIFKRYNRATQ